MFFSSAGLAVHARSCAPVIPVVANARFRVVIGRETTSIFYADQEYKLASGLGLSGSSYGKRALVPALRYVKKIRRLVDRIHAVVGPSCRDVAGDDEFVVQFYRARVAALSAPLGAAPASSRSTFGASASASADAATAVAACAR